jgi:type II secretory pathway pseudopilin PulG
MKGYTLIEMLIVAILIVTSLAVVGINFSGSLASVKPDQVAVQVALTLSQAKRAALSGTVDQTKRTFNLENAIAISPKGISISTDPLTKNQITCSDTRSCLNQQTLCVSGQSFCYTPSSSFTFDMFSGKLTESHVVFIFSTTRRLALLISETGDYTIAEQINGQWRSRTDLQKLYTSKN